MPGRQARTPAKLWRAKCLDATGSISALARFRNHRPIAPGTSKRGESCAWCAIANHEARRPPRPLKARSPGTPSAPTGGGRAAGARSCGEVFRCQSCQLAKIFFARKTFSVAFSLFREATTHNHTHTTPTRIAMFFDAVRGLITRVLKRKRERDTYAGEAIPGLLNDIVVTHILSAEHFDDPADLARLPAVSREMRDAVAPTGLEFEELDEEEALYLGCFSAVQRLQRGGRLSRQEFLCETAARGGHLEKLKELRAKGCPWD
jgi:hypothetical protein